MTGRSGHTGEMPAPIAFRALAAEVYPVGLAVYSRIHDSDRPPSAPSAKYRKIDTYWKPDLGN